MKRLTAFLLLLTTHTGVTVAGEFRAGAAAAEITPTEWPVYLVGSFSERAADQAWDPLHARALVLDDGDTRLAIVVVDNCLIPRSVFDAAKKRAAEATGIRIDHMLMSATHTHSAPAAVDRLVAPASDAYLKVLKDGIVEAIVQADAQREPASFGWGQVDIPEHVHNRRWFMKPRGILPNPFGETTDQVRMNPPRGSALLDRSAGPVDPQLTFVSVRSRQGRPIALLANYSLHYVGNVPAGGVSADYFGEFARQITRRIAGDNSTTPPFVGIMSNGTSGDVNNINFRNPQPRKDPFEQIRYVASDVAEKVWLAWQQTEHRDDVDLAMAQRELTLGLRRPTAEQIERARRFLAEPDEKKLPRRAKAYAHFTLQLAERPPTEDIILQAVRIGDVGIAAIPCEVFAEIGLAIKDQSPLSPSFTIELANGWNRYLPTPQQHRLGGYETWMGTNQLEIDASVKIHQVLLELLHDVTPTADQQTVPREE